MAEDSRKMAKLVDKALGLASSAVGGVVASALFRPVWKMVAHEEEAPKATDAQRGWRVVLVSAAVQGAVFGAVKAVVERWGAQGTANLSVAGPETNRWDGGPRHAHR